MHIDLYSDVVCPWCRIGKHNLFKALEQWSGQGGEPVTVSYRAYLLDPTLPEEGLPFNEVMKSKAGTEEALKQMTGQVTEAGAAVGVTFRFDKVTRMPSTRLAHRFVALLPEELAAAAIDELFRAYFEEGRDVAQLDEIRSIAEAIGAEESILTRLQQGEGADKLEADLAQAKGLGITGVPFFVFNNRYALSGAYPADKIVQLLDKVSKGE
ncbi:DsbA family oxidoreductase [Paenibacillus nasutitermitis]|uniref:DSBA oxidoreductase n=1 Tax=Paenibacillus nasutitermitis TaxID=1652958 RepID=A0A916ZFA8_9BACL|nr:DsbA family oxidoreductase [Paenibacillus nasutitermitis]GGD92968.1 DSBA oxidoreductase [Paenibacillus nasutitermitis]